MLNVPEDEPQVSREPAPRGVSRNRPGTREASNGPPRRDRPVVTRVRLTEARGIASSTLVSRAMIEGFNTDIRHRGRVYHVQSQPSFHPSPALETTIFVGGEVLVRMRSALSALAGPTWTRSDEHHALELQHWNLVRKIRHGMLDEEPAEGRSARSTSIGNGEPRPPADAASPAVQPTPLLATVAPTRKSPRFGPRFAVIVRW